MKKEETLLQNQLKDVIQNIETENNITLSNIQKILISIQDPIASILDVLYGNVNLFLLNLNIKKADEAIAGLLDIETGDEIYYREVILHKNGRPLCYSQSYIPLSRCSEEVIEDLLSEKLTTANIMDYRQIETVRTITNIELIKTTPLLKDLFKTDVDLIEREFNMIHKKKIVVHTKEAFPISYFKM